ncbi:MAG: hypothetical protein JWN86_197 [Planctomycetota bacterium]|nr:hypothetical protein [Planctomycetota bacterium]
MLATLAAAMAAPANLCAGADEAAVRDEEREVFEKIRDLLKKAGTGPLQSSATPHYLCGGDIPESDRMRVGRYCEELLSRAMAMYKLAGFAPRRPERRLTVVALARHDTFADIADAAGSDPARVGFYAQSMRTAFFFLRYRDGELGGPIDWDQSLRGLGHEAMHQICYGTGLLQVGRDIPSCVNEGLATLGEGGSHDTSNLLHRHHPDHFARLSESAPRLPFALTTLFREDDLLEAKNGGARTNLGYAQAWLLVTMLMTEADLRPRFVAYLKAIASRTDREHRMDDVRTHLGNLKDLELRLMRRLQKLSEHPPSTYSSPRRGASGR